MNPDDVKKYEELHRARMAVARSILFAFLVRLGCHRPVWHHDLEL